MASKHRLPRMLIASIPALAYRREHGRFCVISAASLPGEGFRYAAVASKKTARLATARNRMKRRIRAALGEVADSVHADVVCIVSAKPGCAEAPMDGLRSDVQEALRRVLARIGA